VNAVKKRLLTLALVLLSAGPAACGATSNGDGSAASKSSPATAPPTVEKASSTTINETDSNGLYDGDDGPALDYGHTANSKDLHTITALVTRYFAAAATEDGATACSLLYSIVAESVVESYGHTPSLRGSTCASVMSKLFRQHRKELTLDNTTIKVITVKEEGDKALTVLHFATSREARKIPEHREGSSWKILELLDSPLP
jgi:hypothetical protein